MLAGLLEAGKGSRGLAAMAGRDPLLVELLLAGLGPANKKLPLRRAAGLALLILSRARPGILVQHGPAMATLTRSEDPFARVLAAEILAALFQQEAGQEDLEPWLALLQDPEAAVAARLAELSPRVAEARPRWTPRILQALLSAPGIERGVEGEAQVQAAVLLALGLLFPAAAVESSTRDALSNLAGAASRGANPRLRKAAARLLYRLEHDDPPAPGGRASGG